MDFGAVVLDVLGVLVGLFVVRLVVVSVWDAWTLGPRWQKRVQKKAATAVPEPDPLEVWAQHKRRTRLKAEGAWVREWFAALDPEEKREIDALHEEMLAEGGMGFSMPEGYYKDHKVNFVFGEVRDRIGYLAAGTPEKIRRPNPKPGVKVAPTEHTVVRADGTTETYVEGYGSMGVMKRSAMITGAVMRTGSGVEVSAQGFVPPKPPSGGSGVSVPRKYPVPFGPEWNEQMTRGLELKAEAKRRAEIAEKEIDKLMASGLDSERVRRALEDAKWSALDLRGRG